jgi:hypothetical protein
LTSQPETPEESARTAARRWRLIAIGLAIVGLTNLVNLGLNAAGLYGEKAQSAPLCLTIVGVPIVPDRPGS